MNTLVSLHDAPTKTDAPLASETAVPELETPSRLDRPPEPAPKIPPQPSSKERSRRSRQLCAVFALITVAALAYWKRSSFSAFAQPAVPYLPVLPTLMTTMVATAHVRFKDWDKYDPRWIRWVLIVIFFGASVWAVANQNQQLANQKQQNAEKANADARAETAQKAQQDNTAQFLANIKNVNGMLNELQTKIATADLQRNLAEVRAELKKTQEALVPAPKATIEFSFLGFKSPKNGEPFVPLREIALTASAEGVVKIPIALVNYTATDAMQGHVNFFICGSCKFAKEPVGMQRLPGMAETARDYSFPQILAYDAVSDLSLEVTVPRSYSSIEVGAQHRCRNCVMQQQAVKGLVKITWPQ